MKCFAKLRYPEKRHAEEAIERMRAWNLREGRKMEGVHWMLHAYRCPECDFWHAGHEPNRMKEMAVGASQSLL